MKVYWQYNCDFGHTWEFFREESTEPESGEEFCSHGHEAIGLSKLFPADEVQITMQPAAFSDKKGKLFLERRYFLVLHERVGSEIFVKSKTTYLWQDIIKLADRFHSLSKERGWTLWEKNGI